MNLIKLANKLVIEFWRNFYRIKIICCVYHKCWLGTKIWFEIKNLLSLLNRKANMYFQKWPSFFSTILKYMSFVYNFHHRSAKFAQSKCRSVWQLNSFSKEAADSIVQPQQRKSWEYRFHGEMLQVSFIACCLFISSKTHPISRTWNFNSNVSS